MPNFTSIPLLLRDVATLLLAVESSTVASRREAAIKQLQALRDELADLLRAPNESADLKKRRVVERASVRAAKTILDNELAAIRSRERAGPSKPPG